MKAAAATAAPGQVREADEADIKAILQIYNEAVTQTLGVFEETPRTLEAQAEWFTQRTGAGYPVLVAEDSRRMVIGFGSFGPFRPHAGYAATVEHSVYVLGRSQARGVGSRLLSRLMEIAREQDRHVMVGAVDADNHASIALHLRFGFGEVARMPGVARKRGTWRTLVLLQRRLNFDPSYD